MEGSIDHTISHRPSTISHPASASERASARGRIAELLAYELRLVGARLRAELLHAAVEDLGEVQVAFLVRGDRVRAVELARLRARDPPAVQIFSGQVVLDDPV